MQTSSRNLMSSSKSGRSLQKSPEEVFKRARFNQRSQGETETAEQFITSFYSLAADCEFGGFKEQLIRDRIVVGICDSSLSAKLQMDSELTLEKAKRLVRQQEAVRGQQAILSKPDGGTPVQALHHGSHSSDLQIVEGCAFLSPSKVVKSAPTVEKGLTQNNPAQPGKWCVINARKKVITAQFVTAKQLLTFLKRHQRTMAF